MDCSHFLQELFDLRDTASRLVQEMEQDPLTKEIDCSEIIAEIENLLERLRNPQSHPTHSPRSGVQPKPHYHDVYKQIVESISDSLIVIDPDWRITYLNSAATQNTDFTTDTLIGRNLIDAIPAEGQQVLKNWLEASPDPHLPIQFEMQDKYGKKWYLVNAYSSSDGTVILGIDNTFRKIADAERDWFLSEYKRQKAILNAIFEADPSGLAVLTGANLTFAYCNPAFRFLTPDPMVDPIDQPYSVIWPEDSIYGFQSEIETTLQTGKPYLTSGIEHRMPDGSISYFTVQLRRILWDHEVAVLMILWDVTDLKKAENSLREAEQRYQAAHCETVNEKNLLEAVMEALPVGMAILDLKGGNVRSNLRFNRIWREQRPLTQTIEDYRKYVAWWASTGQQVQPEEWASARAIIHGETVMDQLLRIQRFDGSEGYVLNSAAPILNAQGEVVGAAVALQDVTEQHEAELAIENAKEEAERNLARMQIIVNSIDNGLLVMDLDQNIILINDVFKKMVGQNDLPSSQYENSVKFIELIDPSGKPISPDLWPIPRALRGETVQNEEILIRRIHDNTLHKSLVNVYLDKSGDGNTEMVIMTIRDISAQSKIEKQYQTSQEFFNKLLEHSRDCYFAVDQNWTLTNANHRVAEVTGIDLEGRIGQDLWEIFPRWIGTPFEINLRKAMQTRKLVHFSARGMYSNRIYDASIYPDENGLSVFFNNYREGELAIQALHASELRYSHLLEIANEGILTMNASGNIDFINPFGAKTLGYQPGEMIGKSASDFFSVEDQNTIKAFLKRSDPNLDTQFELRLIHHDGHEVWSTVRLSSILTETNEFNGCLILFSDNTERRNAEKALQDSEARERRRAEELSALMDTVPAMIWIARDPAAHEMIGNRYGYEILRMWEGANISKTASEDALAQQPYRNFKNGKEIPSDELPMQIAASKGIPAQDYEFDLVFNDGAKITVLGNVNPIRDENGKPCGAISAFIDVTKVRQAEALTREQIARLEVQHRLLDQREQERLQLARDLHDGPLQDLIAATVSFREILVSLQDKKLAADLMKIDTVLHKLIDDLRHTASLLRPPALTKFGLEKAMRLHAAEITENHPELKIEIRIGTLPSLLPEAIRLVVFRVFQEALNNIIKHAKATRVQIHVNQEEAHIKLKIQDDGIGFQPPTDLNEMVLQGHFGLVGMRERVEAAGGVMTISSQPGEGTTLEASIPLPDPPRTDQAGG